MEKMEQFDDRRLQNLARFSFYSTETKDPKIEKLMTKEKLSNEERNQLLAFIDENRYVKPMSINEMKADIFAKIGSPENKNFNPTVSRSELEQIYKYIMGQK